MVTRLKIGVEQVFRLLDSGSLPALVKEIYLTLGQDTVMSVFAEKRLKEHTNVCRMKCKVIAPGTRLIVMRTRLLTLYKG